MDDRTLLRMIQAAAASQWDTPDGSSRRDRAYPPALPPDNWVRRETMPSMDQYIVPYAAQRELWRNHPNLYSWKGDVDVTPPEIRDAPRYATPIPSGEAWGGVVPSQKMTRFPAVGGVQLDAQGKAPNVVFYDTPGRGIGESNAGPMDRSGLNFWPKETPGFKYYRGMPSIEKK